MENDKNKKTRDEEEATQANLDIQEEMEDDNQHDETSSPVPFVANNTAPLMPKDKNNKK